MKLLHVVRWWLRRLGWPCLPFRCMGYEALHGLWSLVKCAAVPFWPVILFLALLVSKPTRELVYQSYEHDETP